MYRTLLAVTTLSLLTACREPVVRGRGPEKTETRATAGNFNRIRIDAPVDAHVTVGSAPSLSLSGYANILRYVETEVRDSTLYIRFNEKDVHIFTRKNLVANISIPALTELEVAGSGDAVIQGTVSGPKLGIHMSGSGDVAADNISVDELDVDLAGSSDISIKGGTTRKATYSIAGSGGINAFNLQTAESSIEIAGSGDASVNATTALSIDIAGSGDVSYKGHPTVSQSIAGSGDIHDAN